MLRKFLQAQVQEKSVIIGLRKLDEASQLCCC